jgi:hypothetical protein
MIKFTSERYRGLRLVSAWRRRVKYRDRKVLFRTSGGNAAQIRRSTSDPQLAAILIEKRSISNPKSRTNLSPRPGDLERGTSNQAKT